MWYRNFRHKKLQAVMVFMIILLCSMQLTASASILMLLDKPFQELAKECESPSAVLFPYLTDSKDILELGERFKELDEVEKVEFTKSYPVEGKISYLGSNMEVFTELTEYNPAVYGKIRYLEGDAERADTLKEDECIIPACLRNQFDMKTGEKIKIILGGKEYFYRIIGVYADPYNTSTAFNNRILTGSLPETVLPAMDVNIYGKKGMDGAGIEEAFREKNDGQLNGSLYTLEDRISNELIAGNVVGAIFLAIGIIMLFVSLLILNFMIRNAMITDAKTIAIYKTVGYTSDDILRMYLKYYFVIVSAACIAGAASSVFLSDMILISVFENIGAKVTNSAMVPGILCYLLIISFVMGIIWKVMNKTRKVKPVYALSGMSDSGILKKKRYRGNLKVRFSALGIALRSLTRNKKGMISIIITAMVTIFSVNFGIISLDIAYSMKENNDYWLGLDKCDVMIGVSDGEQYAAVREILDRDDRIDYYLSNNLDSTVTLKWKKGIKTTYMLGFTFDDFSRADIPIIKGRNPAAGNEIALSSKMAKEMKKEIGDYVEVYLEGEKRVNLLITGIFQTYNEMGDACRLTTAVYTDNHCSFQYNNFSVYLKDQKETDSFIEDIKGKIGGNGNVIPRTESNSSIMNYIAEPQKKAVLPLCLVVLLVAGINIFCLVMLKNANNEKVNGIYKSIGYSTGHLVLSNLYYIGIIAVASMVIAVPMTILFYPGIMKTSLRMFGFIDYPVNYNTWHLVWSNLAIFLIFILSTLLSSRSLRKVSVRNLVQE